MSRRPTVRRRLPPRLLLAFARRRPPRVPALARRRLPPRVPAVVLALVVAAAAVGCTGGSPPAPPTAEETARADAVRSRLGEVVPADLPPLYEPWADVLRTYVDDEGLVDYAALQSEGRETLGRFMDGLAAADPAGFATDGERIAFWINAYNATVLWKVIEIYPIESVRDVGNLFGLVGGFFKQPQLVAGQERSLDDIEHGILRADYPDPRIHWTLVCAAFGCPRLIRRPYVAADLDPLLAELEVEFLAQPRALRTERTAGVLWLSSYFDWYGGDFEAAAGDVVDYVLPHAPPDEAAWIRENRDGLTLRFMEYDWTLNAQQNGPRSARRQAGG